MQLRIIEIICGMLEQIPLHITIGRISIHVGGILSEINGGKKCSKKTLRQTLKKQENVPN